MKLRLARTLLHSVLFAAAFVGGFFVRGGLNALSTGDPNALWQLIHYACVPDERVLGAPFPCAQVDLSKGDQAGYVVFSDPTHRTQALLSPTVFVPGIESPWLIDPAAPNYWVDAWNARRVFENRVGHKVDRTLIGMAVNSEQSRTQDQLHIHIDCVKPQIVRTLSEIGHAISGGSGGDFLMWDGHRYDVTEFRADTLAANNPFVAAQRAAATQGVALGRLTIVLIGARFDDGGDGFYQLIGRLDHSYEDPGLGEALLDHSCRALTASSS